MSFKQVKDANWRIPYVGGWCEGYVEGAWGQATLPTVKNQTTSGVRSSATAAWNAQPVKHTGRPPAGVTVPVYFSLGSTKAGHAAIALSDGYVASSTMPGFHTQGYLHKSLDDLIAMYAKYNNGCKYLGWGEFVGNIRVVQDISLATATQVKQAYLDILERPADADGLAHYQQYTLDFVKKDLLASKEYKALQTKKAAATVAARQKAEAAAKAAADAAAKAQADAKAKAEAEAKAEADAKAAEVKAQEAVKDPAITDIQNTVMLNNGLLTQILQLLTDLITKFTNIFKEK